MPLLLEDARHLQGHFTFRTTYDYECWETAIWTSLILCTLSLQKTWGKMVESKMEQERRTSIHVEERTLSHQISDVLSCMRNETTRPHNGGGLIPFSMSALVIVWNMRLSSINLQFGAFVFAYSPKLSFDVSLKLKYVIKMCGSLDKIYLKRRSLNCISYISLTKKHALENVSNSYLSSFGFCFNIDTLLGENWPRS